MVVVIARRPCPCLTVPSNPPPLHPKTLRGFGFGSELFLASAGAMIAPPLLVFLASRKSVLASRAATCCVGVSFVGWLAFLVVLLGLHLTTPLIDDPATFGRSLLLLSEVVAPCKLGCSPGLSRVIPRGDEFTDEHGRVIFLRGVNLAGGLRVVAT